MSDAGRLARWRGGLWAFWCRHRWTLLACLGVFVAVHLWQSRHLPTGQPVDFQMRFVSPQDPLQATTLASWRARHPGQPVAVYFWAEWCPVCRAMAPNVTSLAQDHPVLTVAMRSGDAARVQQHLRQRGLPWATAVDEDGQLAQRLGVTAVPTVLVVGADGTLRTPSVGYTTTLGLRWRMVWSAWVGRV